MLGNDGLRKALQDNYDITLPQGVHVNQEALHDGKIVKTRIWEDTALFVAAIRSA